MLKSQKVYEKNVIIRSELKTLIEDLERFDEKGSKHLTKRLKKILKEAEKQNELMF